MKMKKIFFVLSVFLFLYTAGCDILEEDSSNPEYEEGEKLKNIYANDFLIGNIINNTYMSGSYFELLTTHYNTVTCENDMKPDYIAPQSNGGNYRWTTADSIVNKMIANGMKVHGHTFIWHSQTPAWLTSGSNDDVNANLIKYVTDVATHFKGKIVSWDVVNEAFNDGLSGVTTSSDWKNYLRYSGWNKASTEDMNYIELAFRTAREADPGAFLYYNDYSLNDSNKARAVYNMIKELNEKYKDEGNTRNLIDGVGMQGHYGLWLTPGNLEPIIKNFLSLGIRVDISELDIEDRNTGGNYGTGKNTVMTEINKENQARIYARLFILLKRLNREYPGQITRVTMWGMDDKNSWKSSGNPCLFDAGLKPKEAFFAVSNPESYLESNP